MPGESTGGNLVINTKTFPDERAGSFSFSIGGVTDLTGERVAVSPGDGGFDWLGWDDGSRQEDITVSTIGAIVQNGGLFTDSQTGETFQLDQEGLRELQRVAGVIIAPNWDLDFEDATPNAAWA